MHGRAEQEADQSARYQKARLARLEAPGSGDIVDDISGIEGVVAVEQRQQSHEGAKTPVEGARLGIRQFFMDVDRLRSHLILPDVDWLCKGAVRLFSGFCWPCG